jgi:hypothetical protein
MRVLRAVSAKGLKKELTGGEVEKLMDDSWYPLPFPQCPSCWKAWGSCSHRGCSVSGQLEVEPWHENVRCIGCGQQWRLRESTFYCSCGAVFNAHQVDAAVSELVRATRSLYEEIVRRRAEIDAIKSRSEASFSAWLGQVAEMVGGAAGFLVGKLIKIFFD